MRAQKIERDFGTQQSLIQLLKYGIQTAKHEFLFILLAKELFIKEKKVEEALQILKQGLDEHLHSEDLTIAMQKLYRELGDFESAQAIIQKTLDEEPTERIWMQNVQILRE